MRVRYHKESPLQVNGDELSGRAAFEVEHHALGNTHCTRETLHRLGVATEELNTAEASPETWVVCPRENGTRPPLTPEQTIAGLREDVDDLRLVLECRDETIADLTRGRDALLEACQRLLPMAKRSMTYGSRATHAMDASTIRHAEIAIGLATPRALAGWQQAEQVALAKPKETEPDITRSPNNLGLVVVSRQMFEHLEQRQKGGYWRIDGEMGGQCIPCPEIVEFEGRTWAVIDFDEKCPLKERSSIKLRWTGAHDWAAQWGANPRPECSPTRAEPKTPHSA